MLSRPFINLLLINTLIPVKFCHARHFGKENHEVLFRLMEGIKGETNAVVTGFQKLGIRPMHAMDTQALLQLHTAYCSPNHCLHCAVGTNLLTGK